MLCPTTAAEARDAARGGAVSKRATDAAGAGTANAAARTSVAPGVRGVAGAAVLVIAAAGLGYAFFGSRVPRRGP